MDIYSRYVVGWMVAAREAAALAERLLAEAIAAQQVEPGTLNVHADRGTRMTTEPVAMLLSDLGVVKSLSRPRVPDDNPYSESQFKTLKHHPTFPDRFGSIQDARASCQGFFRWYNFEHYHSGIGLLTPADVHYGRATQVIAARQAVLDAAYSAHPRAVRPQATPATPGRRRRCGSTSPSTHRRRLSNFLADLSHRG